MTDKKCTCGTDCSCGCKTGAECTCGCQDGVCSCESK